MKKLFSYIAALLLPITMIAQDEVEFTADRPGMGTGTGITAKGKVMWEAGAFNLNGFNTCGVSLGVAWTIN